MSVIELRNLTKDYGDHRGIFDLTLNIEKGKWLDLSELMDQVKQRQSEVLWVLSNHLVER